MPKNKNKAEGENAFTAANLRATKARSPPPSPILRERPTAARLAGIDPGNDRQDPSLTNLRRKQFVETDLKK